MYWNQLLPDSLFWIQDFLLLHLLIIEQTIWAQLRADDIKLDLAEIFDFQKYTR